jgi:hypothetical protein
MNRKKQRTKTIRVTDSIKKTSDFPFSPYHTRPQVPRQSEARVGMAETKLETRYFGVKR